MKSGTVAIRVPSNSFTQALSDAGKLGTLKNQSLSTQDVTEEYVDLQARITNSEAHVNSLVALLGQGQDRRRDPAGAVGAHLRPAGSGAAEGPAALSRRAHQLLHHHHEHLSRRAPSRSRPRAAGASAAPSRTALHNLVRAFNAHRPRSGRADPGADRRRDHRLHHLPIVRAIIRRNRQREQADVPAVSAGLAAAGMRPASARQAPAAPAQAGIAARRERLRAAQAREATGRRRRAAEASEARGQRAARQSGSGADVRDGHGGAREHRRIGAPRAPGVYSLPRASDPPAAHREFLSGGASTIPYCTPAPAVRPGPLRP